MSEFENSDQLEFDSENKNNISAELEGIERTLPKFYAHESVFGELRKWLDTDIQGMLNRQDQIRFMLDGIGLSSELNPLVLTIQGAYDEAGIAYLRNMEIRERQRQDVVDALNEMRNGLRLVANGYMNTLGRASGKPPESPALRYEFIAANDIQNMRQAKAFYHAVMKPHVEEMEDQGKAQRVIICYPDGVQVEDSPTVFIEDSDPHLQVLRATYDPARLTFELTISQPE